MWTNGDLKIAMTRNRNRTPKDKPFFWSPTQSFSIPDDKDRLSHGRPSLLLRGRCEDFDLLFTFHQNTVVVQSKDFTTTFDFCDFVEAARLKQTHEIIPAQYAPKTRKSNP